MLATPVVRTGHVDERPASTNLLGYQPALDGLRAIAVLTVLLYHAGVGWATGGFLGVDVFFVLSGFLITSLLASEWQRTGGIAILRFYGRRLRRLLPALVLMLAAVALYAATIAPQSQLRELRGDLFATLGYATNWRLVFESRGYFDAFSVASPLKHTWSLAVEEQWYIVWPIVVVGLLSITRRPHRSLRLALGVTATLCVASTIWMAVLFTPGTDPSRVYYGTDTRAQELLAGAVLAFACAIAGRLTVRSPWRALVGLAGTLGLIWLLWTCATVDDRTSWLYEGGLFLLSFVVGAVILAAVQPAGIVRSVLSPKPLRWIGSISYGLYLWHWPIYIACTASRTNVHGTALLVLRLALTFGAAIASFYLLELPIRERRWSPRFLYVAGPVLVAGTVATLLVAASAAPTVLASPVEDAIKEASRDAIAAADKDAQPLIPAPADTESYRPSTNPPPATKPRESATKILTTGDSVALTLFLGFEQRSGTPPALLWSQSVLGCSLFAGDRTFEGEQTNGGPQCDEWRADRERWIQTFDPDVVTVLSGVWETYDRVVDGRALQFGTREFDRWFLASLDQLIAHVSEKGAGVALLTTPCYQRAETTLSGADLPENQASRIDHVNALYRKAAQRNPNTTIVDLHEYVCPKDQFLQTRGAVALRSDDGVHFPPEGAALVRKWLLPQIEAAARH